MHWLTVRSLRVGRVGFRALFGLVPIMTTPIDQRDLPRAYHEVIQSFESAEHLLLAPGVELRMLIGSYNGARNLLTGFVILAPGASYPYYVRPWSEALIL